MALHLDSQSLDERQEMRFIFKSSIMREIEYLLPFIAKSDANVLIQGESGTGKELISRLIHHQSERSRGPFIAINCASIPEALLESELFGHEKGAFTGASVRREGLLQAADGGTVLFDEIGEMPVILQAKLLRVLEEKAIRSLGGSQVRSTDFRLISSTNRNLLNAVGKGQFREDLFYRLNVIPIHIPALRSRPEDVPDLIDEFLTFYANKHQLPKPELSAGAIDSLVRRRWRGNVRELKNFIERTVILWPHLSEAKLMEMSKEGIGVCEPNSFHPTEEMPTIQSLVGQYILYVLDRVGDHQEKAAKILGISRRTLYRKTKCRSQKPSSRDSESPSEQTIH